MTHKDQTISKNHKISKNTINFCLKVFVIPYKSLHNFDYSLCSGKDSVFCLMSRSLGLIISSFYQIKTKLATCMQFVNICLKVICCIC